MIRGYIKRTYAIDDRTVNALLRSEDGPLDAASLISMASEGSALIVSAAKEVVSKAKEEHGGTAGLSFPETAYSLPLLYGWKGIADIDLDGAMSLLSDLDITGGGTLDDGLRAGENAMYASEIIESVRYLNGMTEEGEGFVPDRVLRELGLSFVDETIPGAVLFLGRKNGNPAELRKMVRDCQSKGMVACASGDCLEQMRDNGIAIGWGRMFYPLGTFTATVHALNFAARAAYSFGSVAEGDREKLRAYLSKRPKIVVVHMGPLTCLDAAFAFAALLHSAVVITDRDVPHISGALRSCTDHLEMLQVGIEERGITVKLEPIDLPVAYGPAFEGESVRQPNKYLEAGGTKSESFELLRIADEKNITDGRITVIGKDINEFERGSTVPLGILVEIYGKDIQSDLEPVIERNIHHFLNFAEGVWHAGQRDSNWIRISDHAKDSGLRWEHIGKILVHKIKEEFGKVVTRIQVTVTTDPKEVTRLHDDAKKIYEKRDERMRGLTDDSVPVFYTCTMCQSFAPDHVCIVAPERLGLCGAINWLDAKASNELSPNGPNVPISKGAAVSDAKGEWEGTNDIVRAQSHGNVERMCMYSLMDAPMTSCGCFEAIVAMTADMQAVVIVDRDHAGITPIGMKFSTLAGSIGGGRQTPGFMGIGRQYITSKKFISAEGGLIRVAWMPKRLKESLASEIKRIGTEMGVPDLYDKIADETVTEDAEGLMAWMAEAEHPALSMSPLIE
ncbi:MAG: CO dehydrogenase/CO-methylating acetyl-CoA synthase complex subunit beta [Methanomassiliicoccaceae archaeon]|jgi:acetyl-CoA synthase|nr:CO dehydrogenase/CO-methylating acetyl-CoA synthase complex subunit beta [Methanomassiliicoccaceae archaeon]